MVKSTALSDFKEKDHVTMRKAELLASFLQSMTTGPEEGFTVLFNSTMMLCRMTSIDETHTENRDMLKRAVFSLAADWKSVQDNFEELFPEKATS